MTFFEGASARLPLRKAIGLAIAAACLFAFAVGSARADLVLNIQSVSVSPGSSGNAFDVSVENTGVANSDPLGAFAFELQADSNALTFTQVTTATSLATYIFLGTSSYGPDITLVTGTNPPTVDASDFSTGAGTVIGPGASRGLGRVFFDIAPGTPGGPITITFNPSSTSLSSTSLQTEPIGQFNSGTVTVSGVAAVPEPGVPALAGLVLLGLAGRRFLGRRQVVRAAT